jgi:hypothetical protein
MNDDLTKTDAALNRLKNVPFVAALIVVGLLVIGIAQFTGALSSLWALLKRPPPSPVVFRDLETIRARSSDVGLRLQAKISELSEDEEQADGRAPTSAQLELAAVFEEYKRLKEEECYRTVGNLMAIERAVTSSRDRERQTRAARLQGVRGNLSEACTGLVAEANAYMPLHSPQGAAILRERFQRMDSRLYLASEMLIERWNTVGDRERLKVIDEFLGYFPPR